MAGPVIANVADTAFWIAHHRAVESNRIDALFRDRFAAKLAGERGRKISGSMPMDRMVGWTVAIRTCIIDEFIQAAIREGVDTVLNLGAGLDTRPHRMGLPATLHWIEADYPQLIEHKENVLIGERPLCRLTRVKIDLADRVARRRLLDRADANATAMLVLTEGLIPYLTVHEVASLADDLRSLHTVRSWIVDYFSPQMMQYRRKKGLERHMGNAPFRFEPADWFGFFREHGWTGREIRYMVDASEKLGRPLPMPWLGKLIFTLTRPFASGAHLKAMREFAGYVLLEPIAYAPSASPS